MIFQHGSIIWLTLLNLNICKKYIRIFVYLCFVIFVSFCNIIWNLTFEIRIDLLYLLVWKISWSSTFPMYKIQKFCISTYYHRLFQDVDRNGFLHRRLWLFEHKLHINQPQICSQCVYAGLDLTKPKAIWNKDVSA